MARAPGTGGGFLRYAFFLSLALAILVGLLLFAQADVFQGVVP